MLKIKKFLGLVTAFIVMLSYTTTQNVQAQTNFSIYGKHAITIDAYTGEVLYEKDAYTKDYPASITKIMTAIMLMENVQEDEQIIMSEDAINHVRSNSQILLQKGEALDRNSALYTMMVISANDVAAAIGEHISGTEKEFGKAMTEKAKEIGALKTHFMNASGLSNSEHVTTAYDMAIITKYAMKYPMILDAMGTKNYTVETSEQTKTLVNPSKIHDDKDALGGKTGYTDASGNTLVKIDEVDGKRVINVVMRSTLYKIYDDIKKISDYGVSKLVKEKVVDSDTWGKQIELLNKGVALKAKETKILTRQKEDNIPFEVSFEPIEIPEETELYLEGIKQGEKLGEIKVRKGDNLVAVVDAVSSKNIKFDKESEDFLPTWLKFVISILIPIVGYIGYIFIYNYRDIRNMDRKSMKD